MTTIASAVAAASTHGRAGPPSRKPDVLGCRSDSVMTAESIRVTAIGWKARDIVGDGWRSVDLIATLSRSLYLDVSGEMIWLGPAESSLHGRAVLTAAVPALREGAIGRRLHFDLSRAVEWRPVEAVVTRADADRLREGCRAILAALPTLGAPDGFGALLVGAPPAFPLDRAAASARLVVRACARNDTAGAATAAAELLGLGPGLTPAGDDFVGGVFFARRLLVQAEAALAGPWRDAADWIRARTADRTHRISTTLLGDLLDGGGYAPLHDLATALATAGPLHVALDAARRLIRIGHSSGWDMLAGFIGACLGNFTSGASP